MSAIRSAELASIYDSRGRPTVEATIGLASGAGGRAGAPSGESTGAHEARAFPEGGVPAALRTFEEIVGPALRGADDVDQAGFDRRLRELDGSGNFARIGGNTATALSVAYARAIAHERHLPLWAVLARPGVDVHRFPAIVGNCMNGGRHAIGGPDIQEYIAFADAGRPEESIRAALRVHALLGEELKRRFPRHAMGRGDEGGWVVPIENVAAIELLASVCAQVRSEEKVEVHPGVDFAASEFFRDGRYRYREQTLDSEGQVGFVTRLTDRFGLQYLEDPFEEEAFEAFAQLTSAVGGRALVVGDDLYCSRLDRLERGLALRATNAILIKVNQVGTLSDAFATVDRARAAGLAPVVSHRSGEVPDDWLAHVALAAGARGLKSGLLGGERVAKLNELLRLGRAAEP